MKTTYYSTKAFRSLSHFQRRRFQVYLTLQVLISLLETIGVTLIGLLVIEAQGNFRSSNSTKLQFILPSNLFHMSHEKSVIILVCASAICFIIKAIIAPYLQLKTLKFLGYISANHSLQLQKRLFSQDILFSQKRTTQEMTFMLTDWIFLAYQGVLGFFAILFSEATLLILIVGLLILINPFLTTFMILYFSTLIFLLNRYSKNFTQRHSNILNSSVIKSRGLIQESMISYREVYVSQNVDNIAQLANDFLVKSVDSRAKLGWVTLLPKYILDACVIIGIILVGGLTSILTTRQNAITLCILFLISASRIMPSLLRLNTGLQGINNCSDASERLFAFLQDLDLVEMNNLDVSPQTKPIQKKNLAIEVRGLNFKYPNSNVQVLTNLTFDIKSGEFLAVVGPSGSGKSTLADLLMGVVIDKSSSISIGGLNPRMRVEQNPGVIGYVPQRVSLISGSIKENVALGVPSIEVNEKYIDEALKKASIAEFVKSLPEGLNTVVGENGYNLSGGQAQRIGLARALYTRPEILVLDEATSSLDSETEYAISESLHHLAGKITLIVIAHRLATVRQADKILYLGEGNHYELGKFEDLREKIPKFDRQAKLLGL